ncbi:unnamed protein product [Soboliphyme baturini]|uniref:V-SNARE coiled-coil homology domain-containing protein n=1 Tax=Soboliphyme baturini TaxID=241478 RepID=A0A183J025_9BILA|nr:unnamed protein product [Soboliphyme baturini]
MSSCKHIRDILSPNYVATKSTTPTSSPSENLEAEYRRAVDEIEKLKSTVEKLSKENSGLKIAAIRSEADSMGSKHIVETAKESEVKLRIAILVAIIALVFGLIVGKLF